MVVPDDAPGDHVHGATERSRQEVTVGVVELGRAIAAPNQVLGLPDSIHDVRRGHDDVPHADVQPLERGRVAGR